MSLRAPTPRVRARGRCDLRPSVRVDPARPRRQMDPDGGCEILVPVSLEEEKEEEEDGGGKQEVMRAGSQMRRDCLLQEVRLGVALIAAIW